jgi:hypothetical protein
LAKESAPFLERKPPETFILTFAFLMSRSACYPDIRITSGTYFLPSFNDVTRFYLCYISPPIASKDRGSMLSMMNCPKKIGGLAYLALDGCHIASRRQRLLFIPKPQLMLIR